jgi:MoxR-like ATPase
MFSPVLQYPQIIYTSKHFFSPMKGSEEIMLHSKEETPDELPKELPKELPVKQQKELPKEIPKSDKLTPNEEKFARTSPVTSELKLREEVMHYQKLFDEVRYEVAKIVVGQADIMNNMLEAVLANGHCLVEGIPGIAKTLLLRTLAVVTGSEFKRIQFTPDLLPTDIIGVTAYDEKKGFYTVKGPIFANFVLGDEINRAPPKVQSALLEGMQEKQVTISKTSFALPKPFFVMATQNPIEQMGTYPLPEAQIDRFLYKIIMRYPSMEEEQKIMKQNISLHRFEDFHILSILNPEDILKLQEDVKKIYLDVKIEKYIVRLVDATRNPSRYNLELGKYIEFGSSPRASIALYISSKAHALLNGKIFVTPQDVKNVAPNIFRHRMILNYEGQAEEIKTDDIVKELLSKVPVV